jgi:hypothetical protein
MQFAMQALLLLSLVESSLALVCALFLRARREALVGELLHAHTAPRLWRALGLLLGLAVILLVLAVDPRLGTFAALLLIPAGGAWWLAPATHDQRCGLRGVQYGWRARSLAELDAWRLTGEHLRFRLGPTWLAVAVPRPLHDSLRTRLEATCPDAESSFRD